MRLLSASARPLVLRFPGRSLRNPVSYRQNSQASTTKSSELDALKAKLESAKTEWKGYQQRYLEIKTSRDNFQQQYNQLSEDNKRLSHERSLIAERYQKLESNAHKTREQQKAQTSQIHQLTQKLTEVQRLQSETARDAVQLRATGVKQDQEVAKSRKLVRALDDISTIKRLLLPVGDFDVDPRYAMRTSALRLGYWVTRINAEGVASNRETNENLINSFLRHAKIEADPEILCVYSDGAKFSAEQTGAAAVSPSIPYARLRRLDNGHSVSVGIFEIEGIVLALEIAMDLARPRQRVVLFTDSELHAQTDDPRAWLRDVRQDSEIVVRAARALKFLDAKSIRVSISWLGRDAHAEGGLYAHALARRAATMSRMKTVTLSEDFWENKARKQALDAARDHAFNSDVG